MVLARRDNELCLSPYELDMMIEGAVYRDCTRMADKLGELLGEAIGFYDAADVAIYLVQDDTRAYERFITLPFSAIMNNALICAYGWGENSRNVSEREISDHGTHFTKTYCLDHQRNQ